MFRNDRDLAPFLYEKYKEENGEIYLKQYDGISAEFNGIFLIVSEEYFKEHYTESMTPLERKHGKCVDYRMEAWHDVFIYEDGYEDYVYIGD